MTNRHVLSIYINLMDVSARSKVSMKQMILFYLGLGNRDGRWTPSH